MSSSNSTNQTNNNNFNNTTKPKSRLCKFGYLDYLVLASTISIALAEDFNSNDLSILATFFAVLADELALIGSLESCPSNNNLGSEDDLFAPPVPDIARTSINNVREIKTNKKKKRTVIKKIKRKKLKKK
ncbi:MAG: hypothetical protein ACRC3Y_10090 [Romboutsia sp.]|uniref:hypothetical protein n=1 Tax=Romboutsia sp. TaxID=1965302 RepID=UPI003F353A27